VQLNTRRPLEVMVSAQLARQCSRRLNPHRRYHQVAAGSQASRQPNQTPMTSRDRKLADAHSFLRTIGINQQEADHGKH
jgi:hypothetical protein